MSFEGTYQCICEVGHYYTCDAVGMMDADTCQCGAEPAWVNIIDDTNFDAVGEIPLELLTQRFGRGSDLFRIPMEGETDSLRHYRTPNGTLKPLTPT